MDQSELRNKFVYEPDTGMLRQTVGGRKEYPWRKIGSKGQYLAHTYKGKTLYLHHAVWLYHFGYMPKMLDHVNGNGHDNRIENLRECDATQNQFNTPMKANNRSGAKGVVFHSSVLNKPWQAKISCKGKRISLGYFATKEQAAQAYAAAAAKFAGVFARIN
ncbi:HNH endonuclease [Acinetobacter baumannii]